MKNWDCNMRGDILYEIKYLIHCILYRGIGIEFCWVPSHCGLYWNEMSDKLAKEVAMKNMYEISYYYCLMRLFQYLRRMCKNELKKLNLRYFLAQSI